VGGVLDGGVVGGGISAVGGREQLKSMVNHSVGCQEHPVPKVRDRTRIRSAIIYFLFTLFIAGLIIACESDADKRVACCETPAPSL